MALASLSPPSTLSRPEPPAAKLETRPPVISVEEASSAAELAAHEPAWSLLAERALEPNSFYEAWMLLPAVEAFGGGARFRFVLVYRLDPNKPKAPRTLIGFFPLEERRRLKKLPLRSLALWQHLHCFLCTPLLDRDHGKEALQALLGWTRQGKTPRLLELPLVAADGPFHHLLLEVLNDAGHLTFVDEAYSRALLRCAGGDGEKYLEEVLSTSNRKELRRQRRRLGEQGNLALRFLDKEADLEEWVGHFLTLEAAGWKGQEGTALGSEPAQRDYFTRIARGAFRKGKLMMLGLFLDERPIGLKCNFVSPPGSFAFKIAFDETLARFSPGVQLELDNVLQAHQRQGLKWMDSCAVARHFMINRLWRDRRLVQKLWISTGGWIADLVVGGMPFLRALKRLGRRKTGQ